ncbi:FecR domain-containing protein [Marinicaulis aureus]|uniref:FecR domain-containing protein n=1 Tax=Hyphococcus aureus TaxID=2666033 RepID=A0ABW1L1A2_9PROT
MKQNHIASMLKATVAVAGLILFAAPVMAAECFDEDTDDPKAGNATAVVGPEVGVSRSSRSGVFRPESGDDMFSEDYVRTGDDSHLQLKLCDWSTYSFSPNSESAISEFYDASGAGRRRVVNFVRGGVRYSSGRDTEPGSTEVEIQDSGVTMGVRGTNVIVVEIEGFVYALLEGPLRDNSGLSPKGLVDFWIDENRDQIEASLKRPGWVVRIGPDGISEPYRADEELLKKIYDAFLPVIPEGDGDEQDYAGDPLNESGQGTQEGDDGQQHASKRGLQKNSDTEYYPERPFGNDEGDPDFTVPVGDILPLDLLDDYAGLQTSPDGNLFVIAPAQLTVGSGSSPVTQDGVVMFQIAIDWANRTIAPEALASFVKFDFTVTDPSDLTQRSMTGVEPSPEVIEAFLEAQLASAGVSFMLGEGGLSAFDTPAFSLTVRQGENGAVTVDVSSEFEGSDPNNTPYILAGGADDVLLTPGTGELAYFSEDLADVYTLTELDSVSIRGGSVMLEGASTNVISTLGAPARLTGWSVAQLEVDFANRTVGGGSSFVAVSAAADPAIGGDNAVQYVALDQAASFDSGLFGLAFYTLASLSSDPVVVAGEAMVGPGDDYLGDLAAIIEDGEGNHLYTEVNLSDSNFNIGAISSMADFEARGAVLGGGVFNFDGGFDSAQVQRADGGFSFGNAFAGIDIDFASRTVGGGDSYVEIIISDALNSYAFNSVEFLSAVSFDDAANGAGVFGFGADEFSGSNIENALFLIRDGVGGAGETADIYFNFQDGMGGVGVGAIEQMTRQPGATDY